MKRYIYSIFVLVLFAFVGCVKTDEQDNNLARRGEVLLSLRTTSGLVTRGATAEDTTEEDTSLEERVDWVDVFVFEANGTNGAPGDIFHKERIDVSSAPVYKSGEFALAKKREEFRKDIPYYVYLVANAKANLISDEVASWADLQNLVQTDQNLHFSAFVDAEGKPAFADAPARFLMDGFAYLGNAANPSASVAPEQMGTCVINDPAADEILLCGTIYRAAAKFIINIKQGANVEFQKELKGADNLDRKPQYYINQLPVSTRVLPQQATDYYIATTQNTATTGLNPYTFEWTDAKTAGASGDDGNKMTITGYGYSDDWSKLEYTKQTSMLFNLPMKWDKDKNAENGKEASTADNWYSIPLSKEKRFERNTCYIINVTVNAVGAEEKEYAIELKDIEYTTQPWENVTVDIGGYDAAYLTLNTDLVKIYDTNIDKDQLTFASSSPIKSIRLADVYKHNADGTFQVVEKSATGAGDNYRETYAEGDGVWAYYIDKFGQSNQLGSDPGFDIKDVDHPEWTKEEILAKEKNLYAKEGAEKQYIRAEIWEGQEYALNGNITIHSPIIAVADNEDLNWNSHFNTVRYLEFVVENEQGITATFRVEQIPLSVITNEEGFYSFRDDHVLTDDPNEKPFDLFHYDPDFKSFMTTSMYLVHPHDFTEEPRPSEEVWANTPEMRLVRPEDFKGEPNKEYWNTPQQNRDYSWTLKPAGSYTWLNLHTDNGCPTQGSAGETWIEIRYGFYSNTVSFTNVDNGQTGTKSFSGIHRPVKEDRPYTDYCFRAMYQNLHSEYDITSDKYKGTGLGPYYKVEVLDKEGKKQTRIYRDHFRWNAQPVFWSKFVHKYYSEPAQGASYSGKSVFKQKGQVDMYEYGPSEDGGKTWGRHIYSTNLYKFSNHRMYKVFTTASSQDFTLGYPRLTENGETENTPNNANIVSPTLMLASQLGETNYQQFLETATSKNYIIPNIKEIYRVAKRHCREYVETTFVDKPDANGVYNHMWDEGEEIIEYRDWRLPTKTEIEAIINFQNSSRAMDKVLDAQYYFCITGTADSDDLTNIHNWVSREIPGYDSGTSKGYYIRCVRDVNRTK